MNSDVDDTGQVFVDCSMRNLSLTIAEELCLDAEVAFLLGEAEVVPTDWELFPLVQQWQISFETKTKDLDFNVLSADYLIHSTKHSLELAGASQKHLVVV